MKHSLKSIDIKNFKGIKQTSLRNLPANAPWIFLTGENGFGKTSLLQAIASGLVGMEEHLFDIFSSSTATRIEVFLHEDQRQYLLEDLSSSSTQDRLRAMACYGSSRLDTYSESSRKRGFITESLFDSTVNLENYEYQFVRWSLRKEDEEFVAKSRFIKSLIIDLLGLDDIEISRDDRVYYIEKDANDEAYERLELKDLASGYRNILAFIGDMMLRLFRDQPKVNDPRELHGMVIIDELDLHLHPKWQKKLPGLLTNYFPNIQFIASTHSPIPILGAPKGSVLTRVNRTVEEGITIERLEDEEKRISKFLPNTLLSSPIFGFTDLFPASKTSDASIRTEDDYIQMRVNDLLDEKLKGEQNKELETELLNYIHQPKKRK